MYVELIVRLASISAFFINFVTARTISSSSIIFPFLMPLHFWLSVYITSIWLKLLTSPITILTFEVPMSIPTIISPIAKVNPPICFNYRL